MLSFHGVTIGSCCRRAQIGYKSNLRNSQSITDLREGANSNTLLAASPTSLLPSAGDSSSLSRPPWGSAKDRGKIMSRSLDESHVLLAGFDPARCQRSAGVWSCPVSPVPFWATGIRLAGSPVDSCASDEASFSSDSLDTLHSAGAPSRRGGVAGLALTPVAASSPPPLWSQSGRRMWRRESALSLNFEPDSLDVTAGRSGGGCGSGRATGDENWPRFVCWELPLTARESTSDGPSRPVVRVHPRMRSELNPPPAHKCDLMTSPSAAAGAACKSRSVTANRPKAPPYRRSSNASARRMSPPPEPTGIHRDLRRTCSDPTSVRSTKTQTPTGRRPLAEAPATQQLCPPPDLRRPEVKGCQSSVKAKWGRRVGLHQILPSKATCTSTSNCCTRSPEDASVGRRRGTLGMTE